MIESHLDIKENVILFFACFSFSKLLKKGTFKKIPEGLEIPVNITYYLSQISSILCQVWKGCVRLIWLVFVLSKLPRSDWVKLTFAAMRYVMLN